jgi:hypothetical protein
MKLQDYLHYYMGCKMLYSSHHEPQNEPYVLTFENIKEAIEFADRPIFRRLEDMTEEQARDFLRHAVPDAEYLSHNEYGVIWQSRGSRSYIFYLYGSPAGFHYLLTQHFDLFNLTENGLAVDAKTIQ